MKKIHLVLVLFLLSIGAGAQTYLDENFNLGLPTTYTIGNGGNNALNATWQGVDFYQQTPLSPVRRLNGTPFLFCNGDYPGGDGSTMDDTITTPAMNTIGGSIVVLEFLHHYLDYLAHTSNDTGIVEVFNGASWVTVVKYTSTQGGWASPKKVRFDLTPYKNPNMKVRFRFMGVFPWYWAIDNLRVFVPQANDVGVDMVTFPANDCGIGESLKFKVRVNNYGIAGQSGFPVTFQVNSQTPVTQNMSTSVPAGGNAVHVFTTAASLVPEGVFRVKFWTGLATDGDRGNDTLNDYVLTRYGQGFPTNAFTSYDGTNLSDLYPGWKESSGRIPNGFVSDWTKCSNSQKTIFGTETAKINLLSNNNREWLITPAFRPTAASGLTFKAAITDWQTNLPDFMGADDSLKVMVSNTCGASWKLLFYINAASNLSNQLTKFIVPLQAYAGQEIKLGFLGTDGNVNNDEDYDLHLDDIKIDGLPPIDVGVSAIVAPTTNCGLTNTSTVTVLVRNFGSASQTQFPVNYRIGTGPIVTQLFTGLLAPNQVSSFSFTQTAAIGAIATYTFHAWTSAVGDTLPHNDSLKNFLVENSLAINTFPYFQGFENGPGGWIAGGAGSSWALGTPNKTIINSPATGANSWTTGGLETGTYNSNEKSYVLGPCFNFTNLVNPVIEMKVWWHSEFKADGAALQYSTNGGANWAEVGNFGDPNNWYNANGIFGVSPVVQTLQGWTGGVGANLDGSGGWLIARNYLEGLGGKSLVKLRIFFGSSANVSGDGFAFDDIRIYDSPLKDAELTSIISPALDGCGFTNATPVKIRVTNKGRESILNVPVRYQINNLPVVQEILTSTIDTNSFVDYTFAQFADLSAPGSYNLKVWTRLPLDGVPNNDSIKIHRIVIYNNAIDTIKFTTYNGANLNALYPGWKEAKKYRPTGNVSNWGNCSVDQENFFGTRTAKINLSSNTQREWLISPQFTAEATTRLSFKIALTGRDNVLPGVMGFDDSLSVMVSTDCGANWQRIYVFRKDSVLTPILRTKRLNLSAFAGQRIQVGFYATDGISQNIQNYDLHLDNIFVFPSPAKDMAVTALVEPYGSCGLGSAETIKVAVFNNGASPSESYSISYQINNNPVINQDVTTSLNPDQSIIIPFTTPANFASVGSFTVKVWVTQVGDLVSENNTLTTVITKYGTPTTKVTFSGYNGTNLSTAVPGWSEARDSIPHGNQSNWEALALGSNTVAKIAIAGADLSEWLISPPIKLGGAPNVSFKAALRLPGSNFSGTFDFDDKVSVMVTTNCGLTWTPAFIMDDTLEPALTGAFQNYEVDMTAFENQEVRIAFLANDGSRADFLSDFLLDDIIVTSAAALIDVGIMELVSPDPNAEMVAEVTYPILIRIKNYGNAAVAGPSVFASLNESNFSGSSAGILAPNFTSIVNAGEFTPMVPGLVSGFAFVKILGEDGNLANDTLYFNWNVLTGVAEDLKASDILLYPNPATNVIFIKAYDPDRLSTSQAFVKNVLGQQFPVRVRNAGIEGFEFDINNLPTGVYSAKILHLGKAKEVRFVKM